jgi:hypothetical protein
VENRPKGAAIKVLRKCWPDTAPIYNKIRPAFVLLLTPKQHANRKAAVFTKKGVNSRFLMWKTGGLLRMRWLIIGA